MTRIFSTTITQQNLSTYHSNRKPSENILPFYASQHNKDSNMELAETDIVSLRVVPGRKPHAAKEAIRSRCYSWLLLKRKKNNSVNMAQAGNALGHCVVQGCEQLARNRGKMVLDLRRFLALNALHPTQRAPVKVLGSTALTMVMHGRKLRHCSCLHGLLTLVRSWHLPKKPLGSLASAGVRSHPWAGSLPSSQYAQLTMLSSAAL